MAADSGLHLRREHCAIGPKHIRACRPLNTFYKLLFVIESRSRESRINVLVIYLMINPFHGIEWRVNFPVVSRARF